MNIKCKCGAEIIAADPGETMCPNPDCGTTYTITANEVTWSDKQWITLPAAAKRFDVPLPTLRYHAVRGHFEAHKPDKRTWLVEAGSVEEWVRGRRKKTP